MYTRQHCCVPLHTSAPHWTPSPWYWTPNVLASPEPPPATEVDSTEVEPPHAKNATPPSRATNGHLDFVTSVK